MCGFSSSAFPVAMDFYLSSGILNPLYLKTAVEVNETSVLHACPDAFGISVSLPGVWTQSPGSRPNSLWARPLPCANEAMARAQALTGTASILAARLGERCPRFAESRIHALFAHGFRAEGRQGETRPSTSRARPAPGSWGAVRTTPCQVRSAGCPGSGTPRSAERAAGTGRAPR